MPFCYPSLVPGSLQYFASPVFTISTNLFSSFQILSSAVPILLLNPYSEVAVLLSFGVFFGGAQSVEAIF